MIYDINMTPGGYTPVIHVSQGDDSRLLTLRLVDAPSSGMSYSIKGMRRQRRFGHCVPGQHGAD